MSETPLTTQQALSRAMQHQQAGHLAYAEGIYRQVLAREPRQADALLLLGVLRNQAGSSGEAAELISRAIQIDSSRADYHNNLGIVLAGEGAYEAAAAAFRRALALLPEFSQALYNLGLALQELGQVDEAIDCFRQTLRLSPRFPGAGLSMGNALKDCGRMDEALGAYRAVLAQDADPAVDSNLVYATHFHPCFDSAAILAEHLRWGRAHAAALAAKSAAHANARDTGRRLRIGYVSPDFRQHVLAFYHVPLLSNHDHDRFEIHCYSDARRSDGITARLRGCADVWRDVAGLGNDALAQQIRTDGIDVLVDLSMHMAGNRQLLFARKPAPIQVAWSYPGTTGNPAIDYRLTDPFTDPPGQNDANYSEKSIRLPDSFFIYDALTYEPSVTELPAAGTGYVTFGCLNNFAKVNDAVLDLWAKVLSGVTGSRLVLMAPAGLTRERVTWRLESGGIDPARIEFVARQTRDAYLRTFQRIDICLDTFPYTGHTTTMDALWMGVPTISLVGQTAVARAGFSILSNVGLADWVCDSPQQYVHLAIEKAGNVMALADLRRGLRDRLAASPLMDGRRFARAVEAAFRQMWIAWCDSPKSNE